MPKPIFTKSKELSNHIEAYFRYIEGEYRPEEKTHAEVNGQKKICLREPEPATITGLALFLGFNSRDAFDDYEKTGKFANTLKRGRLKVEAIYEKKLHHQSSAGAIFALKSMGWNEKPESKTAAARTFKNIEIKIFETGPAPSENEKEVIL
jgi:hypothetical protein